MSRNASNQELSRREMISAGIAALALLMLRTAPADAAARARAAADPRHAFADRLADLVIPDTATPGAAKANVALFVLLALDHGMGGMSSVRLERVRKQLDDASGGDFIKVPAARAAQLLGELDRSAFAEVRPAPDSVAAAWRHLKAAIVAGYYTSEIGASKELIYEPVPGKFANITLTAEFTSRSNDGFGGSL
jgi:glucoside 3-dehydrogenase (cytochrome c) hitch-hiker subunit